MRELNKMDPLLINHLKRKIYVYAEIKDSDECKRLRTENEKLLEVAKDSGHVCPDCNHPVPSWDNTLNTPCYHCGVITSCFTWADEYHPEMYWGIACEECHVFCCESCITECEECRDFYCDNCNKNHR